MVLSNIDLMRYSGQTLQLIHMQNIQKQNAIKIVFYSSLRPVHSLNCLIFFSMSSDLMREYTKHDEKLTSNNQNTHIIKIAPFHKRLLSRQQFLSHGDHVFTTNWYGVLTNDLFKINLHCILAHISKRRKWTFTNKIDFVACQFMNFNCILKNRKKNVFFSNTHMYTCQRLHRKMQFDLRL